MYYNICHHILCVQLYIIHYGLRRREIIIFRIENVAYHNPSKYQGCLPPDAKENPKIQ